MGVKQISEDQIVCSGLDVHGQRGNPMANGLLFFNHAAMKGKASALQKSNGEEKGLRTIEQGHMTNEDVTPRSSITKIKI